LRSGHPFRSGPCRDCCGRYAGLARPAARHRHRTVLGADIDGTVLTYSTPDFPAGAKITVARRAGPDFVEFAGTLDGKPLTLRIAAGPCSDGMSDRVYPYAVTREIGPDIERGCARGR
jgi:hypothetical protein